MKDVGTLRSMLMALAAAVVGLALTAQPAQAAQAVSMIPDLGETSVSESTELELSAQLKRRMKALSTVNRRADHYDRAIIGLKAVLATYGYHGDPEEVRLVLPIADYRVSAGFGLSGPLWQATHGGQDFGASSGEPLVAVADGTITEVGDAGPYGLRTILTLEDGTEVWYCHQTAATVSPGEVVRVADEIGLVGSTGNSTGPHLHLEVRPDGGSPIDPMAWFSDAGLTP